MKKVIFVFSLVIGLATVLEAQDLNLSQIKILCNDSSLQVTNSDTSYVFNSYVLTQTLGGINSVTLVCQNYTNGATWTTIMDTVYTWNQVTLDSLTNQQYDACKLNDNVMVLCLGRLYFTVRHKFIFTINGSNGILTREFIF